MRGVNKVILLGRLGQDPEIRYTGGGVAVATYSVATSEAWKDKQTGQKQERTEWHRCSTFQRLAEIVGEYAQKGALVYCEGKLQTRKWKDNAGVERYTTEVVVDVFQILDGGREKGAAPSQPPSPPAQDSRNNPNGTQRSYSAPPPMEDDDIPF